MTNAQLFEKANESFKMFGHLAKFKIEIEEGLNKYNDFIKNELNYSKDLRNSEYLTKLFNSRRYYKVIIRYYK